MEETVVGVERSGEGEFDGVEGGIWYTDGEGEDLGESNDKKDKIGKNIVCRGKSTIVGVGRKFY
jgi:hypothetical protein